MGIQSTVTPRSGEATTRHAEKTLRGFTSFAVAFSFISITTGIFTGYGFALSTAGPAGIWPWIAVAIGQTAVALVYAQLAGHIPLGGYSYQWGSRLANPRVGWWYGWASLSFVVIAICSVDYALVTQALSPLFGWDLSVGQIQLITAVIGIIQALIICLSPRIVALFNGGAVATEIVGVVAIIVLLIGAVLVHGDADLSRLWSTGAVSHSGYFGFNGPFMLAILMGAYTLIGFESASNLAEETFEPLKVVPAAMIRAILLSGIMGMALLIALTLAIPDIAKTTASSAPASYILAARLGTVVEHLVLILVAVSIFACGLVVMTSGGRLVHSMSRDRRFPAHQLFGRLSSRHGVPVWGTLLMLVGALVIVVVFAGNSTALVNLFTAGTIFPYLTYAGTIITYVAVRKRLPSRATFFNLGRWEWPAVVVGLVWLALALCALMLPAEFRTPVLLVGVFMGVGVLAFLGLTLTDKSAFEPSPSDASFVFDEA